VIAINAARRIGPVNIQFTENSITPAIAGSRLRTVEIMGNWKPVTSRPAVVEIDVRSHRDGTEGSEFAAHARRCAPLWRRPPESYIEFPPVKLHEQGCCAAEFAEYRGGKAVLVGLRLRLLRYCSSSLIIFRYLNSLQSPAQSLLNILFTSRPEANPHSFKN